MWYISPLNSPDGYRGFYINMNSGLKITDLSQLTPVKRRDIESLIVNTVKVKLIGKFEEILETPGKSNLRELLIVPIFSIEELTQRVKSNAPELLTVYYKELFAVIDEVGAKISG